MNCPFSIRVPHPSRAKLQRQRMHMTEASYAWACEHMESFRKVVNCTPYFIEVPCGRCRICRKKRGQSWRVRLMHEAQYGNHRNAIFVTLTLAPKYYNKVKGNEAYCMRLFLDRWRKKYGHAPVRWFTTELGEEKGRLHFHGIIWDVPFFQDGNRFKSKARMNRELRKLWKYGNTWVDYVKETTISYIVKYITKPCDYDPNYFAKVFVSPGLGRAALSSAMLDNILRMYRESRSLVVHVGGYPVTLPRYYLKHAVKDEQRKEDNYYKYWLAVHGDMEPVDPNSPYFDGRYLYRNYECYCLSREALREVEVQFLPEPSRFAALVAADCSCDLLLDQNLYNTLKHSLYGIAPGCIT